MPHDLFSNDELDKSFTSDPPKSDARIKAITDAWLVQSRLNWTRFTGGLVANSLIWVAVTRIMTRPDVAQARLFGTVSILQVVCLIGLLLSLIWLRIERCSRRIVGRYEKLADFIGILPKDQCKSRLDIPTLMHLVVWVFVLGYVAILVYSLPVGGKGANTPPPTQVPNLIVTVGSNRVEQSVHAGMKIHVQANTDTGIDIEVSPAP